jgi:hypothetical protein
MRESPILSLTRFFNAGNFLKNLAETTRKERAAVNHHVNFIGTLGHSLGGIKNLNGEACASARKGCGDGSDGNATWALGNMPLTKGFDSVSNHIPIHADGSNVGGSWVQGVRHHSFLGQSADFTPGVCAFQRGQVDHADYGV